MQILQGHIYDYPKYYDLVYGSDWKAEFDFLTGCFQRFYNRQVKTLFEPACGTGRLLIKLAQAEFSVSGLDINPNAVKFCNDRLRKKGFPESAFLGDMADFRLNKKADIAFNTINSFRHLASEAQAESHLQCVANCLKKDGLYILGLHLSPTVGERVDGEEWSARRGNLAVISSLWSESIDWEKRREDIGMSFDVYTPTKQFRIEDRMSYRTYTKKQFENLLECTHVFDIVELFDFSYDLTEPIELTESTEDVVFILQNKL